MAWIVHEMGLVAPIFCNRTSRDWAPVGSGETDDLTLDGFRPELRGGWQGGRAAASPFTGRGRPGREKPVPCPLSVQ